MFRRLRTLLYHGFLAVLMLLCTYYGFCTFLLVLYTVVYPPVTGVQVQRQVEGLLEGRWLEWRYDPVPLGEISAHLTHAAIAGEDSRFYEHFGIDLEAVQEAIEDNRRRGETWRGGSTITQQLVKNLFQTTHSSYFRKGLEVPLTLLAELILTKERILALYVNVIEWGPGVYGIEAAARYHYDQSAARLTRSQASRLAACIPAPRTRTPQRMGWYASIIQRRMRQMGW